MTISAFSQWSTTAADNNDLNDIPLDENLMKGPHVNGAFQEAMKQLASGLGTAANVQFGTLTLNNSGLHLLDTNASHDLVFAVGSNLTADRTLTLTTGDANRTLTLSADVTLDQSVATSSAPSFAGQTLTAAQTLSYANPTITWNETDAGSDEKAWQIAAQGGSLFHRVVTDALGGPVAYITVERTGTTIDSVDIAGGFVSLSGGGVETARATSTILGVGATTAFSLTSGSTDGAYIERAGRFVASVAGDSSLALRRRSSDGTIASFHRDTTNVGTISVTTTNTAYNTSSDERLKKNFEDFDAGALIDQMRLYRYNWIEDGSVGYGPKAQELHTVFPLGVLPGNDKQPGEEGFEPWQWSGDPFTALCLKEIQTLRKRVSELEARP